MGVPSSATIIQAPFRVPPYGFAAPRIGSPSVRDSPQPPRSIVSRFPVRIALAGLSLWSAGASAQPAAQVLVRQLVGDLAVEVRTADAGALRIGAADANRSVTLVALPTDLRRWADSSTKILAARAPGRGRTAQWGSVVAGPGVAAGSMSLSRSFPGDTIVLLITNTEFEAVRSRLSIDEARGFVAAIRRASTPRPPGRSGRPPDRTR